MAAKSEALDAASADRTLIIRRTFDAPRALVFEAWTRKEHLSRWCAPTGFTIPFAEGDVRPGGKWRSCMVSPDGVEHWVTGVYREITPPERLVFTHGWEHAVNGDHFVGHETVVTVTLAARGDQTEMTFHQAIFKTTDSRNGHEGGWTQTFDRLAAYVKQLSEDAGA